MLPSTPGTGQCLANDAKLQRRLELDGIALQAEFVALRRSGGWGERGYFSAAEHDAIEGLLFRFMVNRGAFWGQLDLTEAAGVEPVSNGDDPKCQALALHAGFSLADSNAFLVAEFFDDPVARKKLNESFYRSEIARDTYNRLFRTLESGTRGQALKHAWTLFEQREKTESAPSGWRVADAPEFLALLEAIPRLHRNVVENTHIAFAQEAGNVAILEREANSTKAMAVAHESKLKLESVGYQIRSLVFKDVSRIKSPTAQLIHFAPEQVQQIHNLLLPGDILLSYTAGYVSDVFIPGKFKHGMTYVGTQSAGNTSRDLIEAVAEGVKYSDLDHILDTHINRLLVLRPRLSTAEREEFLVEISRYLGDSYDFQFDFADASRQVCTELIYRGLQGRGGIEFELTQRAGHPTLSADDIVFYHLGETPPRFDFILYAAEDPDQGVAQAKIWLGGEGEKLIKSLMVQ